MAPISGRRARPLAAGAAMLLLTVAMLLAGPLPTAAAHDRLIASVPAADATVDAPITEVRLTFSEPVTSGFAAVTLTVNDDPARPIDLRVDGATVIAVPPDPRPAAPQRWTIAYRIVSGDGHPVVGQLTFAVTPTTGPAATASATDRGSPAAHPPPTTTAPESHPNAWWIVTVTAILAVGGAAVLARRLSGRRR